MKKKEIHSEISSLSDKISYLNDKLNTEGQIHPVELDLLKSYGDKLSHLINQLEQTDAENSDNKQAEISQEEIQETKPPINKKEEEPSPIKENKQKHVKESTDIVEEPQEEERVNEPINPPQESKRESIHFEIMADNDKEEIPEKPKPKTEKKHSNGRSLSLNDRFKKESFELADIIQKDKKERLKDVFDLNDRYTFTKELFENDQAGFENTLKDLESYNDPEEIFNYMERNFESKITSEEKAEYVTRFTAMIIQNIMA